MAEQDVPAPPQVACEVFGERFDSAREYVHLLATDGVVRGLLGPREVPRLWERHILNCAVVAEVVRPGESVVDVGSGAGLPGIVLALARPDIDVTLVEPLARRTSFLDECRTALHLDNVAVYRGRAEDAGTVAAVGGADVVVSRAVASLDKLAAWCLPLLRPGGRMLAVKGASAAEEVGRHSRAVERRGGRRIGIHRCGVGVVEQPTTVVEVFRGGADQRGDEK
jgi:16S rRNA (guanine527-N7)-methyltransferase